ncbi:IclR family transcriptional regulator [Erysipelothrix urinaevulpis]|uniref:IclR family transcriptional regulator n=1 Tax=Erysipelothrix urinaevulpis TaxID=2683717 RepID=UPI001358ECDD|nr:IclR family transcriptional regulator [Erysipelothrix urinaevulpis]
MSDTIKTIENAFDVIDLLEAHEKMGVGEISSNLGLAKTTTHRILKTLASRGIVDQDDQERYTLGYGMYKYARGINHHNLLINLARKPMKEFAKKTGETLNLGVLVDQEVIVIHFEEGEFYALQPTLSVNSPLNCSGMGKIFLSEFDDDALASYFSNEFKQRTINTITSKQAYLEEKQEILDKRLAYDNEEYEYGLSCIATCILDHDDKVIAALSISGPTSRLRYKQMNNLAKALRAAAQEINQTIKNQVQ